MIRRLLTCLLVACQLVLAGGVATAVPVASDCGLRAFGAQNTVLRGTADPVGRTPCSGVRPGGRVQFEVGGEEFGCTLNFLFSSRAEDGTVTRYIGTAGHCPLTAQGVRTWEPGAGPAAYAVTEASARKPIGHFVYAAWNLRHDFALIRLADNVEADPQMCHWGGPTGVMSIPTGALTDPASLRHYGHGTAFGATAPARTAVATDLTHPETVFMSGVAAWGDSGSPVILSSGEAVGVLVAIGGMRIPQPEKPGDVGSVQVQRLPHELARAEDELGTNLELVTGPLQPQGESRT